MIPPILRPAAAADVEEAWGWYEAQREGLGDEFLAVVQTALETLALTRNRLRWCISTSGVNC